MRSKPLRVLLVEDSEDDALLVLRELRRGGFDPVHERVQSQSELKAALQRDEWDVIISDYSLPKYTGLGALDDSRETGKDVPFILVSGSIGETVAVAAVKAGVHDYVLKDQLARLPVAVEREVREARARSAQQKIQRDLELRIAARTEELRQREGMFRGLFESAPDAILSVGVDGVVILANVEAERVFGYGNGEMVGLTLEDLVPDAARDGHARHRESYFANPRVRRMGEGLELRGRRQDGTEFPADISLGPFVFNGRPSALAIVRDVADRKKLEHSLRRSEEQLRQVQKMEAIGSLAGGVAHDFNNLLSIILSYCSLILDQLKPGDPIRADMKEIEAAGESAAGLTRQLLAFGRQQILQPQPIDLNDVVVGLERMLKRLVAADVELTVVPAPALGTAWLDAAQLEQVIINLVVNARDAMPKGGKLTIETANVELGPDYVSAHFGVRPGPHVMLAVTDTGMGMDQVTLARMFEPFFTTKPKGMGSGLGLATLFGIVRQSGGNVWVYSEPGKGTTFKVYFPRSDRVAASPTRASLSPVGGARGTETILLVEDEERVRALASTILRRYGYHVLSAQSGGDALLICEQHGATIHLLLTDVVMPRMSGRQLTERLRLVRPGLKVLYMSGYTDNSIVHHGVLDSDVAFLQKPITPETLTRKVREVLDANEAG